jgi:hypothetical protein
MMQQIGPGMSAPALRIGSGSGLPVDGMTGSGFGTRIAIGAEKYPVALRATTGAHRRSITMRDKIRSPGPRCLRTEDGISSSAEDRNPSTPWVRRFRKSARQILTGTAGRRPRLLWLRGAREIGKHGASHSTLRFGLLRADYRQTGTFRGLGRTGTGLSLQMSV